MNVLRGGADRGYASITFNKNGDKMASVSTAPDYMMTVWDWESERVELHSKAFGQVLIIYHFLICHDDCQCNRSFPDTVSCHILLNV